VELGLGVKELGEATESGFVESHIDDHRVWTFGACKGVAMVGRLTECMPAGAVVGCRGNHDDYNNDANGESDAISKPIHVFWVIIGIHTAAIHDPLLDLIHKHNEPSGYIWSILKLRPD